MKVNSGRAIVAADMFNGETVYTVPQMLAAEHHINNYVYIINLEEVLTDIRSTYSGGPCGPYTLVGAEVLGALTAILQLVRGGPLFHVPEGTDDIEEYVLANWPSKE